MKALSGAILILALGSTACRRPVSAVIQTVPVPGTALRLRVAGSEQQGAQWFLLEGQRRRRLLQPPVTLFPSDLSPSPDGRYLAVLSVGEGHPVLDVLSLPRVLAGTHGERSLRTIDPYPGSIELVEWAGARLKVRSDRPLTDCCDPSGRSFSDGILEQPATFLINPETGEITEE